MEQEPIKTEVKRNEDGTFAEGTAPGPGRPVGKTLKEWMREKLLTMNEEQREEFLKDIPKDMQWRMAEGNPKQDTEHSGNINSTVTVIKYAKGDNSTPSLPTEELPNSTLGSV